MILFKPDCVRKNLSGAVLKRFLDEGFRIRGIKMMQLTEEVLREHYAHIIDLVIDGGVSPGGVPSTVVKVAGDGTLTVLREGAILAADIHRVAQAPG